MEVTNACIHQKIDSWRTSPIGLSTPELLGIKEKEFTLSLNTTQIQLAKMHITCHAPLISPYKFLGCLGFFKF